MHLAWWTLSLARMRVRGYFTVARWALNRYGDQALKSTPWFPQDEINNRARGVFRCRNTLRRRTDFSPPSIHQRNRKMHFPMPFTRCLK
jgi:hypothetical protein